MKHHVDIWVFVLLPVSTLCNHGLVRFSWVAKHRFFFGSPRLPVGMTSLLQIPLTFWVWTLFEVGRNQSNPWFIGRIGRKHCWTNTVFFDALSWWCMLLSYSSECYSMSWRKLRRMLTHQLRMGPMLSCQGNKVSDLVSFASLCFFLTNMLTTCFKIGNWRASLIYHDVSQVDVGETTHIQQLLASKVAELHGIDTVQSLQTLENLVRWVNIPEYLPIHSSHMGYIHLEKTSTWTTSIHGTKHHLPSWFLRLRIANWLWMNGRLFFHVAGPLVRALHKLPIRCATFGSCHSWGPAEWCTRSMAWTTWYPKPRLGGTLIELGLHMIAWNFSVSQGFQWFQCAMELTHHFVRVIQVGWWCFFREVASWRRKT